MPIKNIYEIFTLNGREFITMAYNTLLEREPDVQGMAYYLGRLAVGISKTEIIVMLASSQEGKNKDPSSKVIGLRSLMREYKLDKHWLLGVWRRVKRQEKERREMSFNLIQSLEKLSICVADIKSEIEIHANLVSNRMDISSEGGAAVFEAPKEEQKMLELEESLRSLVREFSIISSDMSAMKNRHVKIEEIIYAMERLLN